ncbi:MAG: hypothetical protein NTZ51_10020, partial [Proteobacteria bacterium]|nr:hypothetical protein [Pseudomonadota bacterium]
MTVPLLSPVRVSLSDYKEWPPEDNDLAAAAESLARDAVANCATRILIPELAWGMRQFNMSLDVGKLAPSAKRRITIVDRHDQTWKAILAYFRPIRSQLMDGRPYSPVVDEL